MNIDSDKLSEGNHTLEVTAFSSTGQSLPVVIQIYGEGTVSSSSLSIYSFVLSLVAVIGLIWLSSLLLLYRYDIQFPSLITVDKHSHNDDVIDAEIID